MEELAEKLLINGAGVWKRHEWEQKQRLQQVLFPKMLVMQTELIELATHMLAGNAGGKRSVGSATGNRTRVLRLRISRPNP